MKKKFNCVSMKHAIQEKLFKELKPKSIDDYLKKLVNYSHKSGLFIKLKPSKIHNS